MKRFITILTLILIITFIPYAAFADDLSINTWIVNSSLLDNGDLEIVEDISFQFKDKFNGVFREIILEGTDGIKNISVSELLSEEEIPYELINDAKEGDANVYSLIDNDNSNTIKIFSPSEDESKTFRLRYTLANVATRHNDIGELYYKFLGEENNTSINYFSATIRLPKFNRDDIRIFGHGPLNGEIHFIEDNLIKLEVKDVSPNAFVEARILFPLEYIPYSENIGNNNFDNIIEEEISYSEKIAENIAMRERRKNRFNNISLIIAGLSALIGTFIFNRFRRDPLIFEEMNSLYPEAISPAELSLFMNQYIDARAILATLFDLSSKGYITIEEIKMEDKKKKSKIHNKDFVFIKTNQPMNDLLEHESFLIDWLFNDIGDGSSVSTLDFERYRKKSLTKFSKKQSIWTRKVQESLKGKEYLDPKGRKASGLVLILGLIILILGVISLSYGAIYGIISIIFGIAFIVYGIFLFTRKSDKGHIQYLLWKDFKKDISTFDKNDMDIPTDKTLIYAIALGLTMEKLNNYRESIDMDYYPMHWGYWYFLLNKKGGSQLEDRFNNSFYGTQGTSSSTSTGIGGSGGFTGGGGGGAGGGGAGGF